MSSASKLAQLRQLMLGMERDLGIHELGAVQKKIVYAASLLAQSHKPIETDDLRSHELLSGVPRSTFFRALRSVVDDGYLTHGHDKKRSSYRLSRRLK